MRREGTFKLPTLHISKTIADTHKEDILIAMDDELPPLDAKDMLVLPYPRNEPGQAAFRRLQHLPGVIMEY